MSNLTAVGYHDVLNDLKDYHKLNASPGSYLGYECLDKYYTHKDGGVTDWTGFPGSGKTYLCLQLLLNLTIRYGKRHMLFVPDIGGRKEIFTKLIKMYTGKDMTDKYHNKIPEGELASALTFIHTFFVIVEKTDFKKGVTPVEFWEYVCSYSDVNGPVHTGLIDSWKNMKHDYVGREDTYLDEVLAIRNELAERNGKHFHTIAHAIKTELAGEKGDGKRRIPTAWDIKGGGSWYANGKTIITVDYPDKADTKVNIYISKVKPEDVGKVGNIVGKMKLDPVKGQYYEIIQGYNFFPFGWVDRPKTGTIEFGEDPVETVSQENQVITNQPTVNVDELPF